MRKGFIAGLLVGGLVGAYYGMQMTVREKSELRGMAMKFAARGKNAINEFGDSTAHLKDAAQEMLE